MKSAVRVALVLLSPLVLLSVAQAQAIPDLVCRGDEVVSIDHSRLTTSKYASTDIYRFSGGKLYISSKEREEYLYSDVREVEPGRYTSAHKTIHFGVVGDQRFRNATAV
ncbi:MAG TPA: hypothetical protein VI789_09395, partial [Dehalococcoidia bacterium]|nr:hypothetical protein [Dehalococcoidia bacterium]